MPRKAYLELLDHPANNKPKIPIEEKANTYNKFNSIKLAAELFVSGSVPQSKKAQVNVISGAIIKRK